VILSFSLPDRGTILLIVGLVLLVASGAMREFVWADLRSGVISFNGLTRSTRILVFLVLGFLAALTVGLVFHEFWRTTFDLATTRGGTPGRGTLVSKPLLPVSLFLLGLATAVALTGALHVRRPLRIAAVLVYFGVIGDWAHSARGVGVGEAWQRTTILVSLLAVPAFFAVRWMAKARPVFEFCVLFASISITLGLSQQLLLAAERQFDNGGVSLAASQAAEVIAGLGLFAIPFLFFIGLDIAEFGLRASGWTVQITRTKLGPFVRVAPYVLLVGLGLMRLHTVLTQLQDHVDFDTAGHAWRRYASALGVVAIIAIAWFTIARRSASPDIHPERVAATARSIGVPLVFIFLGPPLVSQLAIELANTADTVDVPGFGTSTTVRALDFANWVSDHFATWTALVGVGAVVTAVVLVRRGRRAGALFLGITGAITVWTYVTSPNRPLATLENAWTFDHSYLDLWLVVGLSALAVYWAVTRRLTPLRAQIVLMVFVLSGLIAHRDFLENPFDTFFGVAGVALFAFTVAFDLMTVGSWANVDSPSLPRTSRIFAYLGFVIFSLVLVNWALVTNDLDKIDFFTGQGALRGFQQIGEPMLYGVAIVVLTMVGRGHDPLEDLQEIEGELTLFGTGTEHAQPPSPGMTPF
jgi:hypothetical protein